MLANATKHSNLNIHNRHLRNAKLNPNYKSFSRLLLFTYTLSSQDWTNPRKYSWLPKTNWVWTSRIKYLIILYSKLGHILKIKNITLKNDIITSVENIPHIKNTLVVGTKSSGKMSILKQFTKDVCRIYHRATKITLYF